MAILAQAEGSRPESFLRRLLFFMRWYLLYAGVGVADIILGGDFLDYSVLAEDPVAAQHLGILLIEFGVGVTVAGAMISIFLIFDGRDREEDN